MRSPLPFLLTVVIVLQSVALNAETWLVGPTREYKTPSAVATLVKDGDVVSIDPGEYVGDVAVWRAHKLILRNNSNSLRPDVILRADGKSAEQKAIWVIKGDSCVVYGIDFRDCVVPDRNGAGIRVEGTNIIVSHCAFRKNQDGILAGNNLNSTIRVEYSEFDQSGAGDGLSHAIYINHVKEFIFMYNYSHGTLVGHECKSRAHANYIAYNRITNENGTGSRNLDLPNGGSSIVIGNIFHKGANAENGNFIGYGLEGMSDTVNNALYLSHNTFVSERGAATLVRMDTNTVAYRLVNNVVAGPIVLQVGFPRGQQVNANYIGTIDSAKFQDPTTYNYRPRADSPFRGLAQDPGVVSYYVAGVPQERPLSALLHYIHPCEDRLRLSTKDIGAYEYEGITDVTEDLPQKSLYPNPASTMVNIGSIEGSVSVYSQHGICMMRDIHESMIDVSTFPDGLYFVASGSRVEKLIVKH